MTVEFFGVPGAGKTRVLRKLAQSIPGATEALETSRSGIAFGAAHFAFRHPLSFFVWMTQLCWYSNGLFRYKLGLLLRAMAARMRAESQSRRGASVVFVDEGLLQRILTIFDNPIDGRHAAFILKMTPVAEIVVVMTGGEFGRFTEADNRFNSPRVSRGEEKLHEWMCGVRENATTTTRMLPGRARVIICSREESESCLSLVLQELALVA